MSNKKPYNFPAKGINYYVAKYISNMSDLAGKVVLDIPCGDGRSTYEFIKKGAIVKAFDLFPGFMKLDNVQAAYADLTEALPVVNNSVDFILCQEGIEHVPNQLQVLKEFNRVLKKEGTLLITTPNYSHLRARLTHFFIESDYWKRMPPTELDSIWFAENASDKLYFGHLFLLGAQHFQSLLALAGFKPLNRVRTDLGNSSIVLGLIFYPLLALVSLASWALYRKKNTHIDKTSRNQILWERVKLNLSPITLFCKHTFWVLKKESELNEIIDKLKNMHRK